MLSSHHAQEKGSGQIAETAGSVLGKIAHTKATQRSPQSKAVHWVDTLDRGKL